MWKWYVKIGINILELLFQLNIKIYIFLVLPSFAKFIKIIQSVPNQTVSAKMAFLVKEMS